jgi:Sulfotransferase family
MSPKPPFFILGAQRSGTTMLRLMVNRHSRLAVPHESKFILVFHPRLARYGDLREAANRERLLEDIQNHPAVRDGELVPDSAKVLKHRVETYGDLVDAVMIEKARSMGKLRWGDKTPFYTPDIDVLWNIFPEARIVHLVRDGRDVAVSQKRMEWLGNSLPRLAADWRWKVTICHKVGSVRPDHFLEVKYEDLVRTPEPVLRRICEFLEEPFEPEMLRYHETAEKAVPADSIQWHKSSVRPPDETKIGVWGTELSKSDRIVFEEVAGDALDLFAYPRERLKSTLGSKLKNLYYSVVVRW